VLTKNEKNREIFHRFGGKRSFFVLFELGKEKGWSLSGSLFGCFARERESGQKTLKSLKKERVVD